MSKQDRQGVRTPADIERKYDLGNISNQTRNQSEKVGQLNQAFMQFVATTNAKLAELENKLFGFYPIGAFHVSVNEDEPSALFGGEWELVSQGYLVVGLDQENEEALAELQFLDKCYIWKRIS